MLPPDRDTFLADAPWLPADASINDLANMLVAIANSEGGTLVLKLGEMSAEDTLDRLREAALRVEPILVLPAPYMAGEELLTVSVPRGLPHVYSVEGHYVYRREGTNHPLSGPELRRLMIERGELSFEEEPAFHATLDDLDWRAVEAYAIRFRIGRESVRDVMQRRGCLLRQGARFVPTNAGILLFGRAPERFIRGAEITAARFAGEAMGDVFTRQDITGALPDQIRRAETFLRDNLRRAVQLGSGMAHEAQWEYPMEAVRELVVNAVSHRNYGIQGDGIRLYIFADRLEVTSPGRLPGPVTVQNIAEERFSRNPIIVQVLSDLGFIERLGYGVDRVIALMRSQGLPAPEFAETSGGFRAKLLSAEVTLSEQYAVPVQQGILLNSRQESALNHLTLGGHTRITNKDLQELFPDVHPETIRRDLADLVGKGILVKLGQKRGSYYVLQKGLAQPPHA